MPKERRDSKKSAKPYDRTKKSNEKAATQKRSKLNPKKIKLKNEELTDKLDNLLTDLSSHLNPIKKKKQEAREGNVVNIYYINVSFSITIVKEKEKVR